MPIGDLAAQQTMLDLAFGPTATAPTSFEVALFAGDPLNGGTEVSGGGYARVTVPNDGTTWLATDAGGVKSSNPVTFPTSTGDWSDTATHWALYDPATGALWAYASFPKNQRITVTGAGVAPQVVVSIFYSDVV